MSDDLRDVCSKKKRQEIIVSIPHEPLVKDQWDTPSEDAASSGLSTTEYLHETINRWTFKCYCTFP